MPYIAGYGYSPTIHFQQWYWPYGPYLEATLRENCSSQYYYYMHSNNSCPPEAPTGTDCTAQPVVNCLLKYTDELAKADFAAAALLLALIPTILTFAGSTTAESGLLGLRRPILTLLISCGSPATNPMRAFEYRNPVHIIRPHPDSIAMPEIPPSVRRLISIIEYLLAIGTIANVVTVVYEITWKTVNSVAVGDIWLMTIWATLNVGVHLLGWLSLYLRVSIRQKRPLDEHLNSWSAFWKDEFSLCAHQSQGELRFRKETYWFVGISWFTCKSTKISLKLCLSPSTARAYACACFSMLTFLEPFSTSHILPTGRWHSAA